MKVQIKIHNRIHRGIALIISMIFVLIFSALAISMATMSGVNLQISQNQHNVKAAFSSAESGLEVLRYWLNDLSISSSISPSLRLSTIANNLQSKLTEANVSNISISYSGSQLTISSVSLDSQSNQSFTAIMRQIDDDTLQLDIVGTNGQISRVIRTNFTFVSTGDPIFDYSVATKGALQMFGNAGLELAVGADVYIGSEGEDPALTMQGTSSIAGDVRINYLYASVSLTGNCMIGGETGQDAIDNHVTLGVDEVELPAPQTSSFEQYIQNIVDANTDTSSDITLNNIQIVANTNPTFIGHTVLNGIIFIEQPNIVTFSGNATITGIIVGNGDLLAPSELNQIIFLGNVDCYSVSQLPDEEQFTDLKTRTGTFLLAPGFNASFSGNSNVASGVIAASGISFSGNAGGSIEGTLINYSDTAMVISGNSDLFLNPSGSLNNPAGFLPIKVLKFMPSSYSEIANTYL